MLHTWMVVGVLTAFSMPNLLHAAEFTVAAGDVAGLIDAINTANANGEDDTINLTRDPDIGPYTLIAADNDTDGPNGLPSITSVITLRTLPPPPDPNATDPESPPEPATIDRDPTAPSFRILHVSASGRLTLNDLNIGDRTDENVNRGGAAVYGGGLWNAGNLTLLRSKVRGNLARQGGGIFNNTNASLTVNTSIVDSNQALGGGGIEGAGGGIMNRSRVVISKNASISRNTAAQRGGGLANDNRGTVQITNSGFAGNVAVATNGAGGGLQNNTGGTVTLTNCTFNGNGAWFGGGLQNFSGTVTLRNCLFSPSPLVDLPIPGNQAFDGGAIHNFGAGGRVTLSLSAITQNTAVNPNNMGGGGIWNGGGGTVSLTFMSQVADNTPNNCTGVPGC